VEGIIISPIEIMILLSFLLLAVLIIVLRIESDETLSPIFSDNSMKILTLHV
jgi:hypothetical protein